LVAQALGSYLKKYVADDGGMGDFGLTRLEGARVQPDELQRAVQAMGFFSEQRVVVVEGLLSRFGGSKAADDQEGAASAEEKPARGRGKADVGMAEQFANVLAAVPDSTVLMLVERGSVNKNSSLLKAAGRYGKVEEYQPLKGMALERWIADRGKLLGIRLTPGAAAMLGATLPDLEALANELDKLSLYVGQGGTVDETVLRQMSWVSKQDDVFEMTSAAARRDTRTALQQLQRLENSGVAPEGILPVLAWQIRTLIQVRDMIDRRVPERDMASRSGLSDFSLRKTLPQARQFTMPKLLEVHHKLLELDHAVKTGRAEAELSLAPLVVEMCQ
ncbi:MAG: DNA polymerase III subunit delta, partial [Chloroflexota bacterium]|nr:DNA polymerase III subunit delta [Chloroflexota bacterium]